MDFNETILRLKDLPKSEFTINHKIGTYNGRALIGLEYTVEMFDMNSGEPSYHCVLCEKPLSNVWDHWTSYSHRIRYLERHYPTVMRKYRIANLITKPTKPMKLIIQVMADAIEAFHGRLKVNTMTLHEFENNRRRHSEDILNSFHFDERFGPSFLNVVEQKVEDAKTNSAYTEISKIPDQRSILNHKFVVNNAETVLRYKWEQYRKLLKEKLRELEEIQMNYDQLPESHPLYSDEWDIFWVNRFKQLKAENIDPKTYDYKPEWTVFWGKRMQELFAAEVEKSKKKIKASLDLPEDSKELDDQFSEVRIDRHVDDLAFQPNRHYPINSHHSRTLSRSPSRDNVQNYPRTRSRSRSPLGGSFRYREDELLHFHSVPDKDFNTLDNRRNIDSTSPLSHYDVPDIETVNGTTRFVPTHGGRNTTKMHSYNSNSNEKTNLRRFEDPHRETLKERSPNCWDTEKDFLDQSKFANRQNTYNDDDVKAVQLWLEEDSNRRINNIKHKVEQNEKSLEAISTHRLERENDFVAKRKYDIEDDRAVSLRLEEDTYKRIHNKQYKDDKNIVEAYDPIKTLAVIDRGLPDGGIPLICWKKVESLLPRALMEVLKRHNGPVAQFRDAGWFQGRVKLVTFRDARSTWIYKKALQLLGNIWPSARLDLVPMIQVPNRPRAYAKIPVRPSRPKEVLELIQKSNPQLPTKNWKILKLSFEQDGFREITITINGRSAESLKATDGIIRYGDKTIKLRIDLKDTKVLYK